jgi:hypothetical protein
MVALFCLAVCNVHLLHRLQRACSSVTDGEGCVLFWPTRICSLLRRADVDMDKFMPNTVVPEDRELC